MVTSILSTKLHIPSPPQGLVRRERLTSRLDAGIQGKLILVSAPAGFGKTALLAEWAWGVRDKILVSWIQLDEYDHELTRFLSYLVAALQLHHEHLGEGALAGLGAVPPAPTEAILTALVNEIDTADDRILLFLDDYHLVDQPAIHNAVMFLLDHLPPKMCLVIATRVDPPLAIHRLRAQGQVVEIRAEDLRFSLDESRAYLELILKFPVKDNDLAALDNRIEGWAAGLQMLALSMKEKEDIHEFIHSFSGSHRFIVDYLTEEIFNQQPPHIQQFLLKTSILDRLSGPLCDAVIYPQAGGYGAEGPVPGSQQVLEQLEHANLFLLPMDEERHWYRYHALFANVLRQRLRQTCPDEIPGLLRRASTWHAENGNGDEAFQYALAGGDDQAAADLVEGHALDHLKRGTLAPLLDQLTRLPEALVLQKPWLSVYMSWALLLTGNYENLGRYLEGAGEGAENVQDPENLRGHLTAIRAYAAAMTGEAEPAFQLALQALDVLPPDNLTVRSVVSFVLGGINIMRGDLTGAMEAMLGAGETGARAGNIHLAVAALDAAGDLVLRQGQLAEAERIYQQAMELGTGRSGRPLPITAGVFAGLAELRLSQNDLETARQFAETSLELASQWGNPENMVGSRLALAHVFFREGDLAQARDALQKARQLAAAHTLTPGTEERIAAYETFILEGRPKRIVQGTLIEPLTDRELEVLGLIATGRSNPEIAAELIVALGTVKAHTSSIYRKLAVRGRTEAVIKARELGFL